MCRPVVTAGDDQSREQLAGLPVDIIDDASIAGALQIALAEAPHLDAALLLQVDPPATTPMLSRICVRFRESHAAIVASSYDRTIGLPALFGRNVFPDLLALPTDAGVKRIFAAHAPHLITLPLLQAGSAVESPEEYALLRGR